VLAALLLPAHGRADSVLPAGGLLHSSFGAAVADRLVADGFDRARVEALLDDRRTRINDTTLSYAIVYREKPADYSPFLSEERLARARAYLAANRALLEGAAARSGVPAEVATAILMIESDFGSFRKLHPVANVFLSLLWAERPENFDTVRSLIQKRLPEVTAEKIREKTKSKARWGYEQLGFLLRLSEREKLDPLALEGSWAGAFGLPQFIPSSFWGYAVDGSGDGRADLFNDADAVASIGNYLRSFGWKAGLSAEKRHAVIKRYNNSDLYASTVLEAARRLGAPGGRP
jgi:membrane-bound lytic murein transglycosylase B